ncbi:MAG: diguanylate cyclase, partial [Bauldia sp.]|nr:diguanylate cyclase [Bauldia sp.]
MTPRMDLLDLPAAWLLVLVAACVVLGAIALNRHNALLRMCRSERNFRDLYDNISEGVFRTTIDGRMISANPALVRLNGFETEEEMLNEVSDIAGEWYVDANRRAEIHKLLLETGKVTRLLSEVYRYKTRERVWIEESITLVCDERTGHPLNYDGTVREVTDTVRRLQLQERYDRITSVVSGCLYQLRITPDGHASFPYASQGLTQIYGVRPEAVVEDASVIAALIHPDDVERLRESFALAARAMQPRQDEYRIYTTDGVEKWILGHAVPEAEPDGSMLWHGYFVDITEQKRTESKIYDLAYRDTLTGLPNRAALVKGLEAALAAREPDERWGALLFIDLDQFKVLNDTKGHHFGDRLLCGVAERLKPVVGADDLVARLGGDEFVVLVRDLGLKEAAAETQVRRITDRIRATIADPFVLDGFPFHTSASVGVALFRGNEVDVDELLKRADMAMYEAKAAGRGATALFAPEMQAILEEELALTMELRDSLEAGMLELAYQPQVDDAGVCFGVEGLLRWNHPARGAIPPSLFIPLAERAGFGGQIDAYVLATACAALRRWQENPALSPLQMAINVGNRRLDEELTALITNAIRANDLDPSR